MKLTSILVLLGGMSTFLCSAMEFKPLPEPVYQWGGKLIVPGVDRKTGKPNKSTQQYFLWIPENCSRLRGLILANANVIESRFCADPAIRRAVAENDFGIMFTIQPQQAEKIEDMLKEAAEKSGYNELTQVPLILFGHSGNSGFCRYLGEKYGKERILAIIMVKGAWPNVKADGNTKAIDGIPVLFCNGEYEEVTVGGKVKPAGWYDNANNEKDIIFTRKHVPEAMVGGFLDSGHTHMDYCPAMSDICAMFIRKAIKARLDGNGNLKKVDYASGYLTDRMGTETPVKVEEYTGNKNSAMWFFDRELADAAVASTRRNAGKKDQILGFVEDGKFTPYWPGWGMQDLTFKPEKDGFTFTVQAKFYDKVPSPYIPEGKKLGHGDPDKIQYLVSGWTYSTRQVGPNKFEICRDREGFGGRGRHIVIAAYHPGDSEYRECYVTAHFNKQGYGGKTGHKITFPALPDISSTVKKVKLDAKSDKNLKVRYYVDYGPARVINDNELEITALPPKTRYPVEVKVVAYHIGDEEHRETSAERTFKINK